MDGVTVVDHVLLRRLLSILRDKHTPREVVDIPSLAKQAKRSAILMSRLAKERR